VARRCLIEIRIDTHLKCPLLLCVNRNDKIFFIKGFTIKFWIVDQATIRHPVTAEAPIRSPGQFMWHF